MSKLEVEIGASIEGFKKSMAKVLKEFDQVKQAQVLLSKQFKSGKISSDSYYNSIAGLQAQKVKLSNSSTKLKNSIGGVGKATSANAVPALNEFSRVIQDAPYGIQGVANNITQLTTQFGYLTKKTGSSKAALKAMLGSLTGPAGILLAISAVTSLLVSFGGKLFSSSKKADKLKKSTKGLNKELESQSAILKKLIPDYLTYASIKEKTIFNTTKEKEEVKALFAVLRDESKTVDQRARAYKALEKSYTKYLKGVKPKDALKLANAEKQIVEQLEIREKKAQTLIKLEETTRSLQLLNLKVSRLKAAEDLKGIKISDQKKRKLENEKRELLDIQKLLRKTLKQYTALDTSIADLKGRKPIVAPITIGQPAGLTRVDTGVSVAALQAQIKALKDQQTQVSKTSEKWQEYALKIKEVQKQLDLITKGDSKSLLGNTIAGQIAADIEAINIQRLKEKMQEIQFSANMLSQSIQQSFANVTNSISQNLQNSLGVLGSFLGELLNFFTQVIQARIRQQVQEMALAKKQQIINAVTAKNQLASDKVRAASSAAVAASNTAKAAGAKGAFLLPVLIAGALGAVSSAFSKIGGSGGSFGGSSVAGAGSSSGFSSGTTFGGARPFSGNLTFTIRGTDLVAVYNLANSQNAIIGGNVSVG